MGLENLPDILTIKELANFLKINPRTVNRAIEKGDLKAFKAGRDWRIEKESVINWVNK